MHRETESIEMSLYEYRSDPKVNVQMPENVEN
jgi:hypothetical protein